MNELGINSELNQIKDKLLKNKIMFIEETNEYKNSFSELEECFPQLILNLSNGDTIMLTLESYNLQTKQQKDNLEIMHNELKQLREIRTLGLRNRFKKRYE